MRHRRNIRVVSYTLETKYKLRYSLRNYPYVFTALGVELSLPLVLPVISFSDTSFS